jgi:membrane-bound serine protease (ClpP class)
MPGAVHRCDIRSSEKHQTIYSNKLMIKYPFLFVLLLLSTAAWSQKTRVFVMEIHAEIDPRTERYVKLALDEATARKADYLVLNLDTYGGALDNADTIRKRLLEYPKPIFVFIDKNAASAGALISIACDSIYMASGASIGAATVVNGTGEAAPDKYQSYMRSMMRATAEANGRNPKIAEAMVDEKLPLDSTLSSVRREGQVITLTTTEAIRFGYCEAQVSSVPEILQRNGIRSYELIRYEQPLTEKIIAFFLNPFISGLLILIIIGGLYFELQTPGVGFPILASAVALVLYLVPYYLHGLAANWEILLFLLGVGLLAAEIFVIPGFGIAGIAGLLLTFGALVLLMVNNDAFDFSPVDTAQLFNASVAVLFGFFGAILLLIVGGNRLLQSRAFQRLTLQTEQQSAMGYTASFLTEPLIGLQGTSYTVLRPSGKVLINGQIYDAATRGDYIEQGAPIEVTSQEGVSLTVRRAKPVI